MATPVEGADRRFGKYQLIAHIASGGMAEIYLASFEALGGFEKTIVVKRMLPHVQQDPHFVEMFLDEARLAARLNHPNVVQIFDMGQIDERYFIAMEYLAGEALSTLVRRLRRLKKRFPPVLAAGIVMQAAEGLHHAHCLKGRDGAPLNLVHRDVSPQNVFVLYAGGVKVVDFGVAKAADRSVKTRTGVLKGKLGYMSPEQIQNRELDARADVFSLGVVLWESLVCRRLFRGDSEYSVMRVISETDAPSPLTVNRHIPERLADITLKALARDREQRYTTAAELRAELAAYLRDTAAEADTVAVGRFMQLLFKERMASKEEMIDSALAADDSVAQALSSVWRQQDESRTPSVPLSTPTTGGGMAAPVGRPPDSIEDVFASSPGTPAPPRSSALELDDDDIELEPTIMAGAAAGRPGRAIGIGLAALLLVAAVGFAALRLAGAGSGGQDAGAAPLAATLTDADSLAAPAVVDAATANDVTLQAAVAAQPDAASAVTPTPDAARPDTMARPDAAAHPDAAAGADQRRVVVPAVAQERRRPGTLRLKTTPWAIIYYRGKSIGESPLVDVELPSGKLRLRAVNEKEGIDKWFAVDIKPGVRTVKSVKLR